MPASSYLSGTASASFAATLVSLVTFASPAVADTLEVGAGKMYTTPCAAIGAAHAGDTIEVDAAGSYPKDSCSWSTDNLTIRGINGRAKIDVTGVPPSNGKGIFAITAPTTTIENFELSGATSSDANGAGIRHQGLNLTLRNVYLHDNQDGILGGPLNADGSDASGKGDVLLDGCELGHNGAGDGYSHNLYLNHYASVTMQASYSHDAVVGHLFKSRAAVTHLLYNRLTDEAGGEASYEVDLPNAGLSVLIGNVIEQSGTTMNPNILSYGEEASGLNENHHLYLSNNTMVNDDSKGQFVTIGSPAADAAVLLVNNLFAGPGTVTNATSPAMTSNLAVAIADAKLANVPAYDYQLTPASPAVDHGSDPGVAGAESLAPENEYVSVGLVAVRGVFGSAIDVGAYELGVPLTASDAGVSGTGGAPESDSGSGAGTGGTGGGGGPPAAAEDAGGSSDSGGSSSSGGCSTMGDVPSSASLLMAFGAAFAIFAPRRRRGRRHARLER